MSCREKSILKFIEFFELKMQKIIDDNCNQAQTRVK
jgi:hypothetical protein